MKPRRTLFVLIAGYLVALLALAFVPTASAQSVQVDFSQCSNTNSPIPVGQCNWIGSILNAGNSEYFEGMIVPQRILYPQVTSTGTHTISFTYQYTKGGIHAYDFLATVNPTTGVVQGVTGEGYIPGITALNACSRLATSGGLNSDTNRCIALLATSPVSVPIPDDTFDSRDSAPGLGTGSTQAAKENAFEAEFGARSLTVYR